VCLSSWHVCDAVWFPGRCVGEGCGVPGQTERVRAVGFVEQADLQGVERLLDAGGAERRATGGQTVAERLHAAEGPIAEGDVRPDAPVFPVEHRLDAPVMLVGAEAGLDFGQAPVLADQVVGVGRIAAPLRQSCAIIPRKPSQAAALTILSSLIVPCPSGKSRKRAAPAVLSAAGVAPFSSVLRSLSMRRQCIFER